MSDNLPHWYLTDEVAEAMELRREQRAAYAWWLGSLISRATTPFGVVESFDPVTGTARVRITNPSAMQSWRGTGRA